MGSVKENLSLIFTVLEIGVLCAQTLFIIADLSDTLTLIRYFK